MQIVFSDDCRGQSVAAAKRGLCALYVHVTLVDCSNGTMDNTAAVMLLYRQVTGSAPYNAPLTSVCCNTREPMICSNIILKYIEQHGILKLI